MGSLNGWSPRDLAALEALRPLLAGGYVPWTEGALRPAALLVVANEIVLGSRRNVLELGSGVSTVVLARLLRDTGGSLVSVEHSPEWASVVRSMLEREGLTEVATLAEAPLGTHPLGLDGTPWYAPGALAAVPAGDIDLLLVDGPPGYGDGMELSRYPALPELAPRLAPGALVVLDDATREGERQIVARWERELPEWSFALSEPDGIAIGRLAA